MVTRLESRFSQNDSTRVTVNDSSQSHFYKFSELLMNPLHLHTKKGAFSPSAMIKIGSNFLLCLSSCAMLHFKDQVSPTCTEADLRLCFH